SERTEVLPRVEAERSRIRQTADSLAAESGAMCLRCIVEYEQATSPRDVDKRPHVRDTPVEMNRQDHTSARRDTRFDEARVEVEGLLIGLDHDRNQSVLCDRQDRRDVRVRWNDYLVAICEA